MALLKIFAALFCLLVVSSAQQTPFRGLWFLDGKDALYGYYQGYVNENNKADGYGYLMLKPGSAFRGPEPTHIYKGEFVNGVKKGFGQFINSDFDTFYMGQVDNLPNGFGVTLTSDYANKELALCHVIDDKYDYKGICRNGVPGGLGYWVYDGEFGLYPSWGEYELVDGVLNNHGFGMEYIHAEEEDYFYIGYWGANSPAGQGLLNDYLHQRAVLGDFSDYDVVADRKEYAFNEQEFYRSSVLKFLSHNHENAEDC